MVTTNMVPIKDERVDTEGYANQVYNEEKFHPEQRWQTIYQRDESISELKLNIEVKARIYVQS